jgi:hypothetical protein
MANCCRSCVEAQTIAAKADVPISDAACLRFTSREQEADKGRIGIMRILENPWRHFASSQYGHRIELVKNCDFLNELPQAERALSRVPLITMSRNFSGVAVECLRIRRPYASGAATAWEFTV